MATKEKVLIDGHVIGEVEWGPASDFPWAKGFFTEGPDFSSFAHYFQPTTSDERSLAIERLIDDGYPASCLLFVCEEHDETTPIQALMIRTNGTASWR